MKIKFDKTMLIIVAICLAILAMISTFRGETFIGLVFIACAAIATKAVDKCD